MVRPTQQYAGFAETGFKHSIGRGRPRNVLPAILSLAPPSTLRWVGRISVEHCAGRLSPEQVIKRPLLAKLRLRIAVRTIYGQALQLLRQ